MQDSIRIMKMKQKSKWRTVGMGCLGQLVVVAFLVSCLVLALAFVFPSPWNNYLVNASSPLRPFEDPSLDFTIGYPGIWQALTTPHGILTDTRDGTANDPRVKALLGVPFGATLSIYVWDTPSPTTLEEIAADRQELFQTRTGFKVISIKRDTVNDTPALRVEYVWDDPSTILGQVHTHSLEVYVVRNATSYIFRFFGREDNYQEDLFLKMIRTIRFRAA